MSTILSLRFHRFVVFEMSAYQLRLQKAEARISSSRPSSSSISSRDQGFDWIKDAYALQHPVGFDDQNQQPESTAQEEFDWIKTKYDFDTFMMSDTDVL